MIRGVPHLGVFLCMQHLLLKLAVYRSIVVFWRVHIDFKVEITTVELCCQGSLERFV